MAYLKAGGKYIKAGVNYSIGSIGSIDPIPRNGLVAEYLFDGNTNDTSGNGYHLTNNGAILTTDRNGNLNSAYNFGGSAYMVRTPSVITEWPMTFSFWCRTSSTSGAMRTANIGDSTVGDSVVSIWMATGKQRAQYLNASSKLAISPNNTNNGTWKHIVGTFLNDSRRELFESGVSVAVNTETAGGGQLSGINYFSIGALNWFPLGGWIQNWIGDIDDVRIYNRILSQAEITILATN